MTETDTDKELISEDSEIQEVDETPDSCIWVTKENPWPESETIPANVQNHLVFNVKLTRPFFDTTIDELVFAQTCAGEFVSSGLTFHLGDRVAEVVYDKANFQVVAKFNPALLQPKDSSIGGELRLTLESPATAGEVLCFDLLEVHSSADCTTGLPIQGPSFSVSSVELCPLQVTQVGETTTTVQTGEDLTVATLTLKQDCEDVEVRTTAFTVTSDTQITDFKFYDPANSEIAGPSDISIGVEHRIFTDVFTLSKGQERTVGISFDASGNGTVQISLEDFDAQGLTYGLPLPIVGLPLSWTVGIE